MILGFFVLTSDSISGIIKRLLDALKGETISEDILPHFMNSFESLVKSNYNAEVHRSLALFVTYAFHKTWSSLPRTPRAMMPPSRSSTPGISSRRPLLDPTASASPVASSKFLRKKQLGINILEMYTRLLCTKGSSADIRKFAKTVTNKVTFDGLPNKKAFALTTDQWLLYLLAEDDPEVVVCGAKILARLLATQPPAYTSKFSTKTGGFSIMAHRLKQWWDIPMLWSILFSILFGIDVAQIDSGRPFELSGLLEIFGNSRVIFPDVIPVISAMLQHGLRDILKYQDDPDSPAFDHGATEDSQQTSESRNGRLPPKSPELSKGLERRRKFVSGNRH